MQNRFCIGGCIVLLSFITGCEKDNEPAYPIEPVIKFENLEFIDKGGYPNPDELILTISFTDGDADLGLAFSKLDSPYHELNFFTPTNGNIKKVTSSADLIVRATGDNVSKLVTAGLRRTLNLSDIPPFIYPSNCKSYYYGKVSSTSRDLFPNQENIQLDGTYYSSIDTFYIKRNENYYNILIDFLVEQGDGTYSSFDFETIYPFPTCGVTFNGRFPYADGSAIDNQYVFGPFTLKLTSKHSGKLIYTMKSHGFKPSFSGKKIKLQISIKDRALHSSNVIETPPLQF